MVAIDILPSFAGKRSRKLIDRHMYKYLYELPSANQSPRKKFSKFFGVQFFPGAFTREECAEITRIAASFPPFKGETSSPSLQRAVTVRWISLEENTEWIFRKYGKIAEVANRRYRFKLKGFLEPLQHSVYGIGGGLGCHTDVGELSGRFRKLSITVQLDSSKNCNGGILRFPSIEGEAPPKAIGTAIVFPSFLAHEVTEILDEERESLAAWICGPSFI